MTTLEMQLGGILIAIISGFVGYIIRWGFEGWSNGD